MIKKRKLLIDHIFFDYLTKLFLLTINLFIIEKIYFRNSIHNIIERYYCKEKNSYCIEN